MAIFGITREYWVIVFPCIGFYLGKILDDKETLRLSRFRDKSALYAPRHKEGAPPSWP